VTDLLWLTTYLADAGNHFLLSGLTGCLAYCLTQITLCACGLVWERGTRRKMFTGAAYFILAISILAGLSAALLSHVALDGFADWWRAPSGPPLKIDRGPGL